jgi:uncharacterized protein (TIGR02611 family)
MRDREPQEPAAPADLRQDAGVQGDSRDSSQSLWSLWNRWRSSAFGRVTVKIAVGTIGVSVILVGIVLLPLPGPGWLIIFGGLGLLAIEFVWARRLLRFARRQVGRWTEWVRRQPLSVRAGSVVAALALAGGAIWLSYTLLD